MLSLTISTFESVQTQFAFFGFEMWRVDFVVGFVAPTKFMMVLWLVRSITLYAFWALNLARESQMTPFPTVFTLRDTRVRVSHSNYCNKPSDIETSIYKAFSLSTVLSILSQTSFSLYLHNQWTDFHKLSCTGRPQMRAICTYMGCTKVTTSDWDIRPSVAVKASSANISWTAKRICTVELVLESAH